MIDEFLRSDSFETSPRGSIETYYIGNHLPPSPGFFFEVGAVNGFHMSQTATLEKSFGWKGLLVEGHPELFDRLEKGQRKATCVRAIVGDGTPSFFEAKRSGLIGHSQTFDIPGNDRIPCETIRIERILEDANAPRVIDYMVIDVEQAHRRAWDGIDFDRRQINFMAIEMKTPDPEILEEMNLRGFELVKVQGGEDYLFLRR